MGETVQVPEGVQLDVKSRKVTATGSNAVLKRNFKHMPIDLKIVDKEDGSKEVCQDLFCLFKAIVSVAYLLQSYFKHDEWGTKKFCLQDASYLCAFPHKCNCIGRWQVC